jgi:hypothetical protein
MESSAEFVARTFWEVFMFDKTLSILVVATIALIVGHDIDHFARGDYRAGSLGEAAQVVASIIVRYAILGACLYFYVRGKIGPGFWAILGGLVTVLLWFGHLSPFSEQTPQYIYNAYKDSKTGALAVTSLAVFTLVLVTTTFYATILWARASQTQARGLSGGSGPLEP